MERTNRGSRVNSPIKYYATFKGPKEANDVGVEIRARDNQTEPEFFSVSQFNKLGFALISVGSSVAGYDQKNGIFYQSEIVEQGTLNKRPVRLFQTGQGVAFTGTKAQIEAQYPVVKFQIDLICYRFVPSHWKGEQGELPLTKLTLRPAASLAWSKFLNKFKTNNEIFDNWLQFETAELVKSGKKDGRTTLAHHKPVFKLGQPIQSEYADRLDRLNETWNEYGHSIKFYASDWPADEVNYIKSEKAVEPQKIDLDQAQAVADKTAKQHVANYESSEPHAEVLDEGPADEPIDDLPF